MQFRCQCGYKALLRNQESVSKHMEICDQFINISPLQPLNQCDVRSLDVKQLLMFKADLASWANKIQSILDEKGYDSEQQFIIDKNFEKLEPQLTQEYIDEACVGCKGTEFIMQNDKLLTMECGHHMCQRCFVKLYTSCKTLVCLMCKKPIDKSYIKTASTDLSSYECLICQKRFASRYHIKRHTQMVHLRDTKRFCCNSCPSSFIIYDQLETHISSKHSTSNI